MPLPNLQHLTVKYWSDDQGGYKEMQNMLISREDGTRNVLNVNMEAIDAEKRLKPWAWGSTSLRRFK